MFSRCFKSQSSSSLVLLTNFLEFLDLYLFIYFGWLINKLFFQSWSPDTIKYFTFLNIYGVAPIACVFLAYLGDLYGRKPIILNTAALMGVVSISIIFLPVEQYPYFSACGLIALRILQGIALGGEPMGAYLFVMEEKKDIRDATFFVYITRITEGIGGLLALLCGWIVIGGLGEEYWRLLFVVIGIFIMVAFVIRKYLHETTEYQEHLSNARIHIYERAKIRELYHAREKQWQNTIAGTLFWMSYPVMFTLCYLYLTPYVCQRMGWPESWMMYYNFAVLLGEIGFSFLLSYSILYFTRFDLRMVGVVVNTLGLVITGISLMYLDELSIAGVFASQIAMIVLINYGWVFPELFKTFSVIGRYTTMGTTWAIARFISFFTCTFLMSRLIEWYGLGMGALILMMVINAFAFIGFVIMKPYSTIQKELGYAY